MRVDVDVHTPPQVPGEPFVSCPFHDLCDCEVLLVWVFSMEQGGGYPYLVRDPQFLPGIRGIRGPLCLDHKFNVSLNKTKVKDIPSGPRRRADQSIGMFPGNRGPADGVGPT